MQDAAAGSGEAVQAKRAPGSSEAPRPELLPAQMRGDGMRGDGMRGEAVQAKGATRAGPSRVRSRGVVQAAVGNQAPVILPALPAAALGPNNALIQASYTKFMPKVNNFIDCGLKVQGLLTQLRNDLYASGGSVDQMGLVVRIIRSKDPKKSIALQSGWSGMYHVYLRSEDVTGNDLLYDPYIDEAGTCRGTVSEDTALPQLWKTDMSQMERFSVAGAGTDIKISEYMEHYQGNWESLVEHAEAREADPRALEEYADW